MGKAKKAGIGVGVVIGFLAIMVTIGASNNTASETNTSLAAAGSNSNQQQQAITDDSYSDIIAQNKGQSFTPHKETRIIVTGTASVDAGGFVVYPFISPEHGINMQLMGTFTTNGSDEIKVFVADETLFNQWKDGKRLFFVGSVYYTSGYVTSGLIDIPQGGSTWNGNGETLYIVFDNTEDSDYSKRVNADIKLTYTKHVSE